MRTVPVPEGEGISLPLSEISEGMPLQIMVATDNISLRSVFNLVHHDLLLGDCLKEFWVCLTCFDSPNVAIVGICGDSVANGHLAAVLATKCPAEHEDSVAILCS